MSNSKLINPKKKRRVFATKESPFPVPVASITGEPPSETQWMYYTGNLVGNQVIVHHSGDISFLYKMSFFLAYGLGCLRVYENEKLLNLTDLWRAFCQRHNRFISLYVAYHYFRSKGWVPKSGLKFGTDFIIYKEGPPFYHGSYSVIVKMVRDDDLKEEDNLPTLTWTQIAGLNRLTEHVAKQLLICYVIRPTHVNSDLMLSPNVISQFKVKEIVVSRWVSSQERESKSTEEIP
uniref:tRNA-intron lyase n=1 Tax=Magallana gigas TaxID=29159 RepID=K1R4D1_MAGGI